MSQRIGNPATRFVALLAVALLAATPVFAGGLASPGCSAGDLDLALATNPCDPLVDVFTTVGDFTEFTFGGDGGVPPIPADFFFPGSQPFSGAVALFGTSPGGRGDTALRRSATPTPRGTQFPQTAAPVGVELIALSLSSVQPLKVTGSDGHIEEWLLGVSLSGRQPLGELTARFDSPQGGVSDCKVPVVPRLDFVRVGGSGKSQVRTLDFAALGLPPIVLNTVQTPFSTVRPPWELCPGRWFYPGVIPGGGGAVIVSTGPPFEPVRHVVEPPQPKKRCDYRHASSTASVNPPCLPACPAGQPPHKGPVCNVIADCPVSAVIVVNCTTQGTCTEVHNVVGCS